MIINNVLVILFYGNKCQGKLKVQPQILYGENFNCYWNEDIKKVKCNGYAYSITLEKHEEKEILIKKNGESKSSVVGYEYFLKINSSEVPRDKIPDFANGFKLRLFIFCDDNHQEIFRGLIKYIKIGKRFIILVNLV